MSIFIEWDQDTPMEDLAEFVRRLNASDIHLTFATSRGTQTRNGVVVGWTDELSFHDFELERTYPVDYDEVIRIEIRTPDA